MFRHLQVVEVPLASRKSHKASEIVVAAAVMDIVVDEVAVVGAVKVAVGDCPAGEIVVAVAEKVQVFQNVVWMVGWFKFHSPDKKNG